MCHDEYRIDFFRADGLQAHALLPTTDGGFLAVGTPDDPASIAWLDAEGNITATAGPYADDLVLRSATWGPDDQIVLAGTIGHQLWVAKTDAAGRLLVGGLDERLSEAYPAYLEDIQVVQHDVRGILVSAHMGEEPPEAMTMTMTQFNHDAAWRWGQLVPIHEVFTVSPTARGASTVTPSELFVAMTRTPVGLRLIQRETYVPWNIVEPQIFDVEVPGLPASIAALHGDSVVTASNDEHAHIAAVDDDRVVAWHRTLVGVRAEQVGFDPVHDLVFVAGSDLDADEALWIAALDDEGNDVWAWAAPPTLEGPSTPVLDVVALSEGGIAISTAGSLFYLTVHPHAC